MSPSNPHEHAPLSVCVMKNLNNFLIFTPPYQKFEDRQEGRQRIEISLKIMKKNFCIQKGYSGREVVAIVSSSPDPGEILWAHECPPDRIPIGTVEFCEPAFGPHRIDFYPDFLKGRLFRRVHTLVLKDGITLEEKTFAKNASSWKSEYKSSVYEAGTWIPPGEWFISEPVSFLNEWRYYVADGFVVTTGWYAGKDEDKPAPPLDVTWPAGFSGAVDFGELEDGFMALVEAHAPFACGWYGDNHQDYAAWQRLAWNHADWWRQKIWLPSGAFLA